MNPTSNTLLLRLRKKNDDVSWERFVHLYTPMMYRWAINIGLTNSDAADLLQDVFLILMKRLPEFEYDPGKSFRSWLKTVTLNRARDFLRQKKEQPSLDKFENLAMANDDIKFLTEQEYHESLVQKALELMKVDFEETTWNACKLTTVDGKSAREAAEILGISANAVYLARSRVLRKLRTELSGLLDDS